MNLQDCYSRINSQKNGNDIKEKNEVDQVWMKIRTNIIDNITKVDIRKVNIIETKSSDHVSSKSLRI